MKLLIALLFPLALLAQTTPPSPSVTLNWTNATSNPSGTLTNVQRAPGACGTAGQTFAKLNTTGVSGTTYTDTAVLRGQSYCYHVTATNGTQESVPSPTAQADIPLAPPSGLSINVNLAVTINVDGVQVAQGSRDLTVTIPGQGQ